MARLAETIIEPIDSVLNNLLPFQKPESIRTAYGPPLTDGMIAEAERRLGLKLPPSYLEFLRIANGGFINGEWFEFGEHEVEFRQVHGIGYEGGIDGELGSAYMIEEWGYPSPAIWLDGDGHTAIMLDYREPFTNSEPPVIWVDTEVDEGVFVAKIAENFADFISAIVSQIADRQG